MTQDIIYVVGGLLAAGELGRQAYRRFAAPPVKVARPVDLDAFRNLMDPVQEAFLRQRLPAGEFREVRKRRMYAALAYLEGVRENAAALQNIGKQARLSAVPEMVEAGRQLEQTAVSLRAYVFRLKPRIWAGLLLPGVEISSAAVADRYQDLCGMAGRLRRLSPRGATAS
jgi:hypothetical protein